MIGHVRRRVGRSRIDTDTMLLRSDFRTFSFLESDSPALTMAESHCEIVFSPQIAVEEPTSIWAILVR